MNDANTNTEKVAARARALIEADVSTRVDAVRVVADAANAFDAAETGFREAASAHESAWKAALNAGWSEKDLRATGARAPGQTARKARAKRATATSSAENTDG